MRHRIISIQHGDYAEALELMSKGESEPYFGMKHTLDVLHKLFDSNDGLVLSIDTKKSYNTQKERVILVGLERYKPLFPVPETMVLLLNARRICKIIKSFKPTHILIRTGGIYAWKILQYCSKNNINTLVVFANTFDNPDVKSQFVNKKIVKLLNQSFVFMVANHKQPATDSMIDCGVNENKAKAWDWPNAKQPSDYPIKKLQSGIKTVVYVGSVIYDKGVSDLIEAAILLQEQGKSIKLIIVGEGNDTGSMQEQAGSHLGKDILFLGRIDNDKVFELMLRSDLVCVPSRHEFTEGMPLTLTEALASRTPVIISDHPVFKRAFVDGEGVSFFPEKNSNVLAKIIKKTLLDEEAYKMLSMLTKNAFERVVCQTTFGDVITQWQKTFK